MAKKGVRCILFSLANLYIIEYLLKIKDLRPPILMLQFFQNLCLMHLNIRIQTYCDGLKNYKCYPGITFVSLVMLRKFGLLVFFKTIA